MFYRGLAIGRIEQLVRWGQGDVCLEVVADTVDALADANEGRELGLADAGVVVARDAVSWQVIQVRQRRELVHMRLAYRKWKKGVWCGFAWLVFMSVRGRKGDEKRRRTYRFQWLKAAVTPAPVGGRRPESRTRRAHWRR